jgi:hypothetical protein
VTACTLQASGTIELYFYGELDELSHVQAERHLASCAECRQALDELRMIRSALAARPDVCAPPAGDWTAFMQGLRRAIHQGPQPTGVRPRPPRVLLSNRHVAFLAMAALFALAILSIGYIVRSRSAEVAKPTIAEGLNGAPAAPEPAGSAWSADAAFASLSEQHFERSKLVVLGLANKNPVETGAVEWEYERALASTLLSDTRLYREAAEDRGMTALAGTMADLELVLLQASLSSDREPATLEQIQSLIRKRDLLTKMNVTTVGM